MVTLAPCLFAPSVAALAEPTATEDGSASSHRISFLHYHKTGHDLSRVLASAVRSTLAILTMKARPHSIRARFDDELSCSGPDAVEVWTAPELFQRVAPVHLSTLPESDGLRLMAFANILGGDVT